MVKPFLLFFIFAFIFLKKNTLILNASPALNTRFLKETRAGSCFGVLTPEEKKSVQNKSALFQELVFLCFFKTKKKTSLEHQGPPGRSVVFKKRNASPLFFWCSEETPFLTTIS
jgi:hypothetical protein